MAFEWNHDEFLILDGATGTVLQQNGLPPGGQPELLNLTRPELIRSVHRAYAEAGSHVVYANTFGASAPKLARSGHSVEEIITAGVHLAQEAVQGTQAHVALDVGPLGELLEPMGYLSFEQAYEYFCQIMRAGAAAGAELIVIETMTDLYEAKAALLAAKETTQLPVFVTMSFEANGRTFTGCTVESMARTLEALGADAIGVNCSLGPVQLEPLLRQLCRCTRLPVIAKPNAGLPDPVDGHYDLSAEDFAQAQAACAAAGISILGGCCGTTPEYIRALCKALNPLRPAAREYEAVSFVCTPVTPLRLQDVHVIGERINPTGKKRFQQALLEDDLDYILDVAIAQQDAGAEILDVNVGYPGVDEAAMLPRVVKKLQSAVDLPLQLDSTNPAALEAGLRVYNGRAAVNSVNGEAESLARILPIVKKYGASVVGLALDENGIPQSAAGRVAVARRILDAALAAGIAREDVWIDCLTLTVSAQQDQAQQTLQAVRTVHSELGLQTVLGVSNISFGLPNRPLITQSFLTQAMAAGLTLPIINPNQGLLMDAVAAFRVLSCADSGCAAYVARFAGAGPAAPAPAAAESLTLDDAIARGLRADAARLARAQLAQEDELSLVEGHLIPALDRVGAGYEQGTVFLPQLLSAAQAAQSVFEVIRESIASHGGTPVKKGALVIATVQGDIHDIGKNIVKTVLENYGYDVIDLGRDVAPQVIVDTVVSRGIRLVGLSALMTTTLPAMEKTVAQLRALPNPPATFVGGAVLTPEWAAQMGADYYAKDARQAVEIARKVLGA